MRIVARLLVVIFALNSASCAYLFHGTSDQIHIQSADPNAEIYLDDNLIGRGSATATVDRGKQYTMEAKAKGCAPRTETTGYKFDSISLLGLLIDLGIISILVVDMAATDAAWKTYPLDYSLNPICPAPENAPPPAAQSSSS